ncbi:MAG: transcriptional regulator [Chloroflexi bacterium]|nr:MAG: transcriptional regulator [Chloroflexota bacterium]
MLHVTPSVGMLLRNWRQQRRMSQLDLALRAEVSARHISFLETGRAQPSREMVLRLAEQLDVPLRERNTLLVSAGYAPVYRQSNLDDPTMGAAKQAIDLVLRGHEPYPALAVDRHWNLIAANAAVTPLLAGVAPELLQPPINVLRISMHPGGLAGAIENPAAWREHVLARLQRQIDATGDQVLLGLRDELRAYPAADAVVPGSAVPGRQEQIVIPLRLRYGDQLLSFLTTTTVFGAPLDITLAELALELFYPADAATAAALSRMAGR